MSPKPPKPELPAYLTEIPGRRPLHKMYHNIGHAKTAFSWSDSGGRKSSMRPGKLYELVDGDWELIAEIKPGQKRKDHPLWAETEAKRHGQHHEYVKRNPDWHLDRECPWCGKTGRQIVGIGP